MAAKSVAACHVRLGCGRLGVLRQHAVGRQAFDGEWAAHANDAFVLVGLIDQRFRVSVLADGGIDLAASHALFDVRVVRDALECDVWHPLVNEATLDVLRRGRRIGDNRDAGQFRFLFAAIRRIGKKVVWEFRTHQPGPSQRQCDSRRVDRDPAPAPLLRNVCRRAGTAGRIEHEIAGVRRHEKAALDCRSSCLYHIDFWIGPTLNATDVGPSIRYWICRKVIQESNVGQSIPGYLDAIRDT